MVQWLQEIQDIVQEYKSHYGRNLEKDVVSETSGHFKRLLVSMCQVTAWEYPCAWRWGGGGVDRGMVGRSEYNGVGITCHWSL